MHPSLLHTTISKVLAIQNTWNSPALRTDLEPQASEITSYPPVMLTCLSDGPPVVDRYLLNLALRHSLSLPWKGC